MDCQQQEVETDFQTDLPANNSFVFPGSFVAKQHSLWTISNRPADIMLYSSIINTSALLTILQVVNSSPFRKTLKVDTHCQKHGGADDLVDSKHLHYGCLRAVRLPQHRIGICFVQVETAGILTGSQQH